MFLVSSVILFYHAAPALNSVDFLSNGWRPIPSDARFAGCFPARNAAIVLVFPLMRIF
jgi:hypothetical protein